MRGGWQAVVTHVLDRLLYTSTCLVGPVSQPPREMITSAGFLTTFMARPFSSSFSSLVVELAAAHVSMWEMRLLVVQWSSFFFKIF